MTRRRAPQARRRPPGVRYDAGLLIITDGRLRAGSAVEKIVGEPPMSFAEYVELRLEQKEGIR